MKPRIVFSRTRKVRRSFTLDDKIIQQYVELYGITLREAREKYKLFILRTQLSNPNFAQ